MKLRIRDNSVRLRLTRSEVDALREQGRIAARTEFPSGASFQYVLESSPASVRPGAGFANNVMTVRLPETAVQAWATTEEVSIQGEHPLDEGGTLSILVEKDFQCLTDRDEDDSDMFPHPEAGQAC